MHVFCRCLCSFSRDLSRSTGAESQCWSPISPRRCGILSLNVGQTHDPALEVVRLLTVDNFKWDSTRSYCDKEWLQGWGVVAVREVWPLLPSGGCPLSRASAAIFRDATVTSARSIVIFCFVVFQRFGTQLICANLPLCLGIF